MRRAKLQDPVSADRLGSKVRHNGLVQIYHGFVPAPARNLVGRLILPAFAFAISSAVAVLPLMREYAVLQIRQRVSSRYSLVVRSTTGTPISSSLCLLTSPDMGSSAIVQHRLT